MTLRVKNIIYSLGLLSAVFLVWHYRQGNQAQMISITGETMGTTYHISYFDEDQREFQSEVDSILKVFNHSLNTYLPDSEISQFNTTGSFQFDLPYFKPVLESSQLIVEMTGGAFDPTVMPFVNAWGFGPQEEVNADSLLIDSLSQYVGFEKVIDFNDQRVTKKMAGSTLDFSAIAKGYGVDVVADFLRNQGLANVFVEIGGEVVVLGENMESGNPWRIAIVHPESEILKPTFMAYVTLDNQAIATSANNFNYRLIDGVKYSHTISPQTGFPIVQEILSATVFADNCMTADALATSFMVMGHESAIEVLNNNPHIGAFLIYSNGNGGISTYITDKVKDQIELL
jgi:thiamine biosynthesis lipoprotein